MTTNTELIAPTQPDHSEQHLDMVSQPMNELVEAAQNAIGCFNAAGVEGLDIALTETTDERLKDLIERRLMHAPGPLADALANAKAAQSKWNGVNYFVLQEFAQSKGVSYNELCSAVNTALESYMPAQPFTKEKKEYTMGNWFNDLENPHGNR